MQVITAWVHFKHNFDHGKESKQTYQIIIRVYILFYLVFYVKEVDIIKLSQKHEA